MIPKRVFIGSLAFAAGTLFAQAPAFEVAAIKPAPATQNIAAQVMSGKVHVGMRIDGDRVDIGNLSLESLIQAAYKVKPYQISGPSWMSAQRFDILANMPAGASRDQVPEMLQALLADRFKLTIHRESKEHPIYALVVAKGGSKLIAAAAPEPAVLPQDAAKNDFAVDTANGRMSVSIDTKAGGAVVSSPQTGKMRMSPGPDRTMIMEAERMTMTALADQLSTFLDRPVIDLTELRGGYQVKLELAMTDLMQAARSQGIQIPIPAPGGAATGAASDPSGSSIFESIQKLGLRLEPRKMPMDLIVVDSLEKTPTEN